MNNQEEIKRYQAKTLEQWFLQMLQSEIHYVSKIAVSILVGINVFCL